MITVGKQYLDSTWKVIDGRWITPNVIFNTIKNGIQTTDPEPGKIRIIYDNIFVVVSDDFKRIITLRKQ
jgi:hypothetical protein